MKAHARRPEPAPRRRTRSSARIALLALLLSIGLPTAGVSAAGAARDHIKATESPSGAHRAKTFHAVTYPRGFTPNDTVFRDTFGGRNYRLLRHWNFGIASKRSRQTPPDCDRVLNGKCWSWGSWVDAGGLHYEPWWMSGKAPYLRSYANASQENAECFVPSHVSQTAGGGTYRHFNPRGHGLRMTASKGATTGCPGKTWRAASVNTFGKVSFGGPHTKYYVEVRAKLPYAMHGGKRVTNGSWVGFWILPSAKAAPKIRGGQYEVDILESGYRWNEANPMTVATDNVHRRIGGADNQHFRNASVGIDLSKGYHDYAARVNTKTHKVRFFVDGEPVGKAVGGAPPTPMFLMLTLQVAGPGNTWEVLPSTNDNMHVDVSRVRVFQRRTK